MSFHPYSNQVRYYLATADHLAAHLCRPHRYGPFVRCFLARPLWSVFPLFARSPSRMRRRILFREGRPVVCLRPARSLASRPPRVVVLGYRMTQKDFAQNNHCADGIRSISGFDRIPQSCMDSFDPTYRPRLVSTLRPRPR